MSDKTEISWTDATWNPTTGCTKVSPGCEHCYIDRCPPFRMAGRRFVKLCSVCKGHGIIDAAQTPCPNPDCHEGVIGDGIGASTGVELHPERLDQPLRWRRPRRVFVNSLSDLFHDEVPDEFIARVFAVMALAPQHTFQVLTKRHGRMRSLLNSLDFRAIVEDSMRGFVARPGPARSWYDSWSLPNVWLGVTVEDQKRADLRIPALLETPAAVRFLSCEPLLGPINLRDYADTLGDDDLGTCDWGYCDEPAVGLRRDFGSSEFISMLAVCARHRGIDWVICGGESGPGARPMHPDWARSLRDQCVAAGVPFFFKQWGEWGPDGQGIGPVAGIESGRRVYVGDPITAYPWSGAQPGRQLMARVGKKAAGDLLDGLVWHDYPEAIR